MIPAYPIKVYEWNPSSSPPYMWRVLHTWKCRVQSTEGVKRRSKSLTSTRKSGPLHSTPWSECPGRACPGGRPTVSHHGGRPTKHCRQISRAWFRSTDLWVMAPARFHCATLLFCLLSAINLILTIHVFLLAPYDHVVAAKKLKSRTNTYMYFVGLAQVNLLFQNVRVPAVPSLLHAVPAPRRLHHGAGWGPHVSDLQ